MNAALPDYLRRMVDAKASDLFFSVGAPPSLKIDGVITPLGEPALTADAVKALALKNGTFASPAVARASSVLPVPGTPESSTPLGTRAPRRRYFPGFLRKSTTSLISASTSSMPATSLNVTRTVSGSTRF